MRNDKNVKAKAESSEIAIPVVPFRFPRDMPKFQISQGCGKKKKKEEYPSEKNNLELPEDFFP